MSFRSRGVRSHPWVRTLGGDRLGNQRGLKIDESVILLSQSSCVSFRISNQFRIFDIGLKGFKVDSKPTDW